MQASATLTRVKQTSAALLLAAASSVSMPSIASAQDHSRLSASYEIRFAGLKLGKFDVWSNVGESSYSLRGKGELKFLTGLIFEISGGTTTRGAVTAEGPRPATFAFDFDTGKHKGELAMNFEGNAVSHVVARPPFVESAQEIPLTPAHVRDVLDPMSALFFTARANQLNKDGSICPSRIPVFDGKQRFDLVLSHKRTVQVKKRKKSGYGGKAVVCRIKYVPIAGYKADNKGVTFMAETDDIEVWLIRVPQKNMYVPYHVVMPTPIGTASATSTELQVEIPGHQKIIVIK